MPHASDQKQKNMNAWFDLGLIIYKPSKCIEIFAVLNININTNILQKSIARKYARPYNTLQYTINKCF